MRSACATDDSRTRRPIAYGVTIRPRHTKLASTNSTMPRALIVKPWVAVAQRRGPMIEANPPMATTERAATPGTQRATE